MKKIELSGAILLDENNKILLIHRNTKEMKQWELPGGKIEKGEIPEDTCIRELKEELDIQIEILKYIDCKEFEDNGIILKYNWYKCKIIKGTAKLMEDKFDDIRYFSMNELIENKELSSNMRVLVSNINIEKL
ncbi:MAG: NUDIX hydrolase [Clostridia bacterium]|nr:NUDIX hydrolase [Clostridia bacterium]